MKKEKEKDIDKLIDRLHTIAVDLENKVDKLRTLEQEIYWYFLD